MAPIVSIRSLQDHVGEEVTLQGWLYNKTGKGKLQFLQVRDGSGICQAVLEKEVAYVPPQAVFVYTHSANPDLRDTYEFRPEHFSSVGRRLEDYQIDISKLFLPDAVAADGTPVLAKLTPPAYNWSEWEEE